MTRYLTIYVRVHDGRYHGTGDELPSPFRLFQALVAGAGISGPLEEGARQALAWFEAIPEAPIIASPRTVRGQAVKMYMPNNDLDKFAGDVRKIAKTRGAKKIIRPQHFDATVPWIYAWPFAEAETEAVHADLICRLSEKLYQLGRGEDMAWAWGERLDEASLDAMLLEYDGVVRRPSAGHGLRLACPREGSLESLTRRHRARRFRTEGSQRVFVQQPQPIFRQVAYGSPPARCVFELRATADSKVRVTWPLKAASPLVVAARQAACERLRTAMPDRSDDVDRYLVGRRPDGSNAVPADSRVRIMAIPSIGMHHADHAIRRILVEVPATCSFRSEDIRWAFSGAELATEEVRDIVLSPSTADEMLRHYGVGLRARVFRSVTPVVLPDTGRRRRIEPTRTRSEAKGGLERVVETSGARAAVLQALRHAGVRAPVESVRLQREPFAGSGSRVEPFASGTRFEKTRLWHTEVAFAVPVEGPLLLGDGRFLGLGLMAPVRDIVPGDHAFTIVDGLTGPFEPHGVTRALRRAVMARVQAALGHQHRLPPFFSGHESDGAPVRRSHASHLSFAFDPELRLLLVLAPHIVERRAPTRSELEYLRILDTALEGFGELRAGAAGRLSLSATAIREREDAPLGNARVWQTVTPYVVTRHVNEGSATEAFATDVRAECRRLGLPAAKIESNKLRGAPGIGLMGNLTLHFEQLVQGPLLLGRTRHLGGGLLRPVQALGAGCVVAK